MALQVPPGFRLVNIAFWESEAHFYPKIVYHPLGHSGPGWEGPFFQVCGMVGPDDGSHGKEWWDKATFIDTPYMGSEEAAEEAAQKKIDEYCRKMARVEEVAC